MQYSPLDIISYQGSCYIVLQDAFGVEPPNDTYYMLLASKGDTGVAGNDGAAATISVGSTTTGATASVTNSGTSSAAVLDFVIPVFYPTALIMEVQSYYYSGGTSGAMTSIKFSDITSGSEYTTLANALSEGRTVYIKIDSGYIMNIHRIYTNSSGTFYEFEYYEASDIEYKITIGSNGSVTGIKSYM
jgi:hypothetical protein